MIALGHPNSPSSIMRASSAFWAAGTDSTCGTEQPVDVAERLSTGQDSSRWEVVAAP